MQRVLLAEEGARRRRKLLGKTHDVELDVQRSRDDFNGLAGGERVLVADVVRLAGGSLGVVRRQRQGVAGIGAVRRSAQGEAAIGHDDPAAAVDDAPHDQPLAGVDLAGPVDERVAEDGGVGVVLEQHVLGGDDLGHLVVGVVDRSIGRLAQRGEQAAWPVLRRTCVALVNGDSADGDELPAAVHKVRRQVAQPAVHGVHDIEGGVAKRLFHFGDAERIGVDVRHLGLGRDGVDLVAPGVQDRDVVPALEQPVHHTGPRGPRAADHQRCTSHRLMLSGPESSRRG